MVKAGDKAGGKPGTRAGTPAGDAAGEKTKVTMPKQTIKSPGGTVSVGTIHTEIATMPAKAVTLAAPKVHGVGGATAEVNVRLDGNDVLASDQAIKSPGATITVNLDQNQQAADKPTHKVKMTANKVHGAKGGTIEVTPEIKTLSE